MTADGLALFLIVATAPAQTAFIVIYGFGSPWWRTWLGRAVFTKGLGLALLIDMSVAYQLLGDDYPGRDIIRNSVYALIAVGAWLQLAALIGEKRRGRRDA